MADDFDDERSSLLWHFFPKLSSLVIFCMFPLHIVSVPNDFTHELASVEFLQKTVYVDSLPPVARKPDQTFFHISKKSLTPASALFCKSKYSGRFYVTKQKQRLETLNVGFVLHQNQNSWSERWVSKFFFLKSEIEQVFWNLNLRYMIWMILMYWILKMKSAKNPIKLCCYFQNSFPEFLQSKLREVVNKKTVFLGSCWP